MRESAKTVGSRTLRFLMKATLWIVLLIFAVLVCEVVFQVIYPAGLETGTTKGADALLFSDYPAADLPKDVEIRIDGTKAVFHRDTKPFDDLVELLHGGRSDELMVQAGEPPRDIGARVLCGEMVISSYGVQSHFKILRSNQNTNYYWIRLPKLTSLGTHSHSLRSTLG